MIYRFTYPDSDGKLQWQVEDSKKLLDKYGKEVADKIRRHYHDDYLKNPIKWYLPHGVQWHKETKSYAGGVIKLAPSLYEEKWGNDGVAFLNDRTNPYCMFLAPRKVGKSSAGAAWIALRAIKCDPDWPIFKNSPVVWHPFDGPCDIIVASFKWKNVKDLWKVYRKTFPPYELGEYAPGKKDLRFGDREKTVPLASGSTITFMCYSQSQATWESFEAKLLHADEQIPRTHLRAWEDGTSNQGDYTPACFTLSGFVIDDRPDTGAVGPLKIEMWDAKNNAEGKPECKGKTVGRYNMDMETTPDAIIGPAKKKERWNRYGNPKMERSKQDERRGHAVLYPGWEMGSGLAFGPDVWQREIHVINPLWKDDKTPKGWTKWRTLDYCDSLISVCSWWAISPKGVAFLYRLLYEKSQLIADFARKIIEMSHNTRADEEDYTHDQTGVTYKNFREIQSSEEFYRDILDGRMSHHQKNGIDVIDIFRMAGLNNLEPASSAKNVVQIPAFKDWLRIYWKKDHIITGEKGAPNLYFFDGLTQPEVDEMERVPLDPRPESVSIIDVKVTHDFIDSAKYWATDGPSYMGSWNDEGSDKEDEYVDEWKLMMNS